MLDYFECEDRKWGSKKMMCLPLRLHEDLRLIGKSLLSTDDLEILRQTAQNRDEWQDLITAMLSKTEQKYYLTHER